MSCDVKDFFFYHFWLVRLWERGRGRQYSGEMKIKDLGTNLRILTQIDAEVAKKRNRCNFVLWLPFLEQIELSSWDSWLLKRTHCLQHLHQRASSPVFTLLTKSRGTINRFSFLQVSYSRLCMSRDYYTKTHNIKLCFNSFLMNLSTKLQRQAQAEASTWHHSDHFAFHCWL